MLRITAKSLRINSIPLSKARFCSPNININISEIPVESNIEVLAIPEVSTSNFFEKYLVSISEEAGYGLGIVEMTIAIRIGMIPIQLWGAINSKRSNLIRPEMQSATMEMMHKKMRGDFEGAREIQDRMKILQQKYNISAKPMIFGLLQIIFPITWFLTLTRICRNSIPTAYPGISTDGFLWFKDLTIPDPYFILPLVSGAISFLSIMTIKPENDQEKMIFGKMKYLPLFSIPIMAFLPAGVTLYITTFSALSFGIGQITKTQTFDKIFKIPEYFEGTIKHQMAMFDKKKRSEINEDEPVEEGKSEIEKNKNSEIPK